MGATKELTIIISEERREILMALLGNIGFEGFWEEKDRFTAYIAKEEYQAESLQLILDQQAITPEQVLVNILSDQNWNKSWESNFPPVEVDSYVQIVAHFHEPKPDFHHTIHITPKMSFGTGHHETTRLMVRMMATMDFSGKNVLDMGCGTGVLGILASCEQAASVTAIDIDEWSYLNTLENIATNQRTNVRTLEGGVEVIPDDPFDIILANINLNVLLSDIPAYARRLNAGGLLLVSGFRPQDEAVIQTCASDQKLSDLRKSSEGDWMTILFQK